MRCTKAIYINIQKNDNNFGDASFVPLRIMFRIGSSVVAVSYDCIIYTWFFPVLKFPSYINIIQCFVMMLPTVGCSFMIV